MRTFATLAVALAAFAVPTVNAGALDLLKAQALIDPLVTLDDFSAQFLYNANGGADNGDTTLDVGDQVYAMFNIENIDGVPVSSTGAELTALVGLEIVDKSFGGGLFTFQFAPVTSDPLGLGFVDGQTMVRVFDDSTTPFNPFGPDDAPGFAAEAAALATASDGFEAFSFGFTGEAGTLEFYTGTGLSDNFAIFADIPFGNSGGTSFNFSLNLIMNNTDFVFGPVPNFPVTNTELVGSGNLNGILDSPFPTPFDTFDNADLSVNIINVIPEPFSVTIWAAGFAGLALVSYRRRRAAKNS